MKWYFIVVLICIFLIVNDVDYLLMCLLAILYVLWKNVYLDLCQFLIGLLVFCFNILSCMRCSHILDINSLSIISFANIFSDSVGCLFILSVVSFALFSISLPPATPRFHPGLSFLAQTHIAERTIFSWVTLNKSQWNVKQSTNIYFFWFEGDAKI